MSYLRRFDFQTQLYGGFKLHFVIRQFKAVVVVVKA